MRKEVYDGLNVKLTGLLASQCNLHESWKLETWAWGDVALKLLDIYMRRTLREIKGKKYKEKILSHFIICTILLQLTTTQSVLEWYILLTVEDNVS